MGSQLKRFLGLLLNSIKILFFSFEMPTNFLLSFYYCRTRKLLNDFALRGGYSNFFKTNLEGD